MSAFTEFVCIAVALYLWESTLWLPLRGVALRKRWFTKGWKVLDPHLLMATREVGMVAFLPVFADTGVAACQGPVLMVGREGRFLIEQGATGMVVLNQLDWNDLSQKDHHFHAAGVGVRISSPRGVEILRRARARGVGVESAVRQAMKFSLSPIRSKREWRRWKKVSGPLRFYGPLLTLGGFAGLPLSYTYLGTMEMLVILLWLWLLMVCTACHLWWLGRRVYPEAKAALGMDALLSLVVPFHAMRAHEIASVHAMGSVHAVGLLLGSGDLDNAWLCRFIRKVRFPRPGVEEDKVFSSAHEDPLAEALARCGREIADYDRAPDHSADPDTAAYCPRCHGMFLESVSTCPDCAGMPVRSFDRL